MCPVVETIATHGEGLLGKSHGKMGDKNQEIKVRSAAVYGEHHKNGLTEQLYSRVVPCLRHTKTCSVASSAHKVPAQLQCWDTAEAVPCVRLPHTKGVSDAGTQHWTVSLDSSSKTFATSPFWDTPRFSAMKYYH